MKWLKNQSNTIFSNVSNITEKFYLMFLSANKKGQIVIKFMKKNMEWKTLVKFLGVLRNSNLRWKSHITETSKKLSRAFGIFCKIWHFVLLEILKVLYISLFFLLYLMTSLLFWYLLTNQIITWPSNYKSKESYQRNELQRAKFSLSLPSFNFCKYVINMNSNFYHLFNHLFL